MIISADMSRFAVRGESNRNRMDRLMRMIEIEILGKGKSLAKLDERNPKIREAFFDSLPIEGTANLWGEEVYFDVAMQMENENPSPSAVAGDVCYWSPGPAFCIFFGKTQPYSAVNHIGKVTAGLEIFRMAETGDRIVIRRR